MQDTCTLVALKLSAWSARKHDASASANVTSENHAQQDAARVNKLLVSKDWLGPINKIDNLIRAEFYRLTLAYPVTSIRVLPESARKRFNDRMTELFIARGERVNEAIAFYDGERSASRTRLGDLFSESDYPTAEEVHGKYNHRLVTLPMPAGWKAGVDDATVQAQIEEARREGFSEAYNDAWQRIADCAKHVADKLAAFKPANGSGKAENVFRDSLVENARELVETLESMVEMFGDERLNTALAILKEHIASTSPEMLREDERTRAEVTAIANGLLKDALAGLETGYSEPERPQAPAPTPMPQAAPAELGETYKPYPSETSDDLDMDALLD